MTECPICKSEIKLNRLGRKTVEIICTCQGDNYLIASGSDDDLMRQYVDKVSKNESPEQTPKKIIGDIPATKSPPISEIEKNFPTDLVPRDIQKQILKEIQTNLDSGYKKIVISAPTGVGKSAMGIAISQYFGDGFFVTGTKSLQDQYTHDFPQLRPVKGKSNFECLKIMEKKKIEDPILAKELGHTCEKGDCDEGTKKNSDGIDQKIYCSFKPSLKDFSTSGESDGLTCTYYNQKYLGLKSDFSLWNYSAFFQLMKNSSIFAEYLGKKVCIFDEAHGIEDQIINFIGIDISNKQLEECSIDVRRYDLSNNKDLDALLIAMRTFYGTKFGEMKKDQHDGKNVNESLMKRYDDNFIKITDIIAELNSDPENFVVSDKTGDLANNVPISIKPLVISKYVDDFFKTECQIFMSATINKANFCETMGLDDATVAFIDTPKSPFPYDHRKVEFLNVASLTSTSLPKDEESAIKKIDELLTEHKNERGLILTSSIKRCNDIRNHLSPENKKRISICHSKNSDGTTQDEKITQHRKTPNSVLLSSSLWEGVDLKDEDSRFQIIAKVPYKSLGDKRVLEKMKKFQSWYDYETMVRILQGFGRSIRSESDWAITYVIDSKINDLIKRTRSDIPKAYWDVLKIS